jgi:regulator of protease activity HflC (stomatin/prohibitin superfamily)
MEAALPDFLSSYWLWAGIVIAYILKKGVHFVPQNRGYVVYTLGKYTSTLTSGLNFIVPFISWVEADRNLKEQVLDITSQTATTKDNITLAIDGVLFIRVTNAADATNNVTDYKDAVMQLAQTTMRNAIGSMELDDCFQRRDDINSMILASMEDATNSWGVKVTRYEIKDITPPHSIKEDMERQMSAEREKRSTVLEADGKKLSAIAVAEGDKRARVLDAEAAKTEVVLAAEANRESQMLNAEGEAMAILKIADAKRQALELVGKAASTKEGKAAVQLELAERAIDAHKAIAKEGTVVLTDGKTGDNIGQTVSQALAVSSAVDINKS